MRTIRSAPRRRLTDDSECAESFLMLEVRLIDKVDDAAVAFG